MIKKIIKYVILAFLLFCIIMAFVGCVDKDPCSSLMNQRYQQIYNKDYHEIARTDSLIVKLCKCE